MKRDSTVKRLWDARLKESGKLKNQISFDWDLHPPTAAFFKELFRVSKNQIIWGGNYFDLPPTRCIVCWDKEQVFENFSQVEMAWTSFNMPAKLFRYSNGGFRCGDKSPKIHPTQKPVKLYHYLLDTFAKPGDRIFDSHLGSGSSRIAAYRLGFDFHATEIDKIFFDAQEKRFRQECFGEFVLPNGKKSVQYSLFTD